MPTDFRSLLDRIEDPEPRTRTRDTNVAAIQRHLQLLLGARAGTSPTVPDFGTRDRVHIARGAGAADRLAHDIQRCITRYEPRLVDVRVRAQRDEGHSPALAFRIEAEIRGVNGTAALTRFRSVLRPSGGITVGTEEQR